MKHLSRHDGTIMRRLRIGHTRATHSYLLTKESPPECQFCFNRLTKSNAYCKSVVILTLFDSSIFQRYRYQISSRILYTVSQQKKIIIIIIRIVVIDFDDIWQKYSKVSTIEFACFSFHVGLGLLFFINFSSFKPDTENNANFDVISTRQH